MKYLLDTNICIYYLNRRSEPIIHKLNSILPQDVAVCSVVKAELFYGAMKSSHPEKTLSEQREFLRTYRSLPFDDDVANQYGRIRAYLDKQGTPIGPNDLLIAAVALAHDLTLVTHNTDEFNRVPGLRFEDWETLSENDD